MNVHIIFQKYLIQIMHHWKNVDAIYHTMEAEQFVKNVLNGDCLNQLFLFQKVLNPKFQNLFCWLFALCYLLIGKTLTLVLLYVEVPVGDSCSRMLAAALDILLLPLYLKLGAKGYASVGNLNII